MPDEGALLYESLYHNKSLEMPWLLFVLQQANMATTPEFITENS